MGQRFPCFDLYFYRMKFLIWETNVLRINSTVHCDWQPVIGILLVLEMHWVSTAIIVLLELKIQIHLAQTDLVQQVSSTIFLIWLLRNFVLIVVLPTAQKTHKNIVTNRNLSILKNIFVCTTCTQTHTQTHVYLCVCI